AAHLASRSLEIRFPKAKPRQDLLGFRLQAVTAQLLEAIVSIVVDLLPLQRFDRMLSFPGLDEPTQFRVLGRDGAGKFHYRFVADRGAFLRQMPKGNVTLPGDLAGIG